jgi:hypothetical protein
VAVREGVPGTATGSAATWRYGAFGVPLVSAIRVPQLPEIPAAEGATPTVVRTLHAGEGGPWKYPREEVLTDRRQPDGRLMLGVDRSDELGFRVWSPGYGRFLVSGDGTSIAIGLPGAAQWKWQRLLFAQVLPLTAALRGLMLLHASAVAVDGAAYALTARSGTGKTSTALHLVANGASLVTDDVLAVGGGADVLAYPGARVVSVNRLDLQELNGDGTRFGQVAGGTHDKLQLGVDPVTERLPLAAIYFLERDDCHRELAVAECTPDARDVLGATFIPYLRSPRYLLGLLECSASVSRRVRMFRVQVPEKFGAATVSRTLLEHMRSVKAPEVA